MKVKYFKKSITCVLSIFLLLSPIIGPITILLSFPRPAAALTAPTLADYNQSTWTDTSATETTGSVSWQTGDIIVVMGSGENGAITGEGPALKRPTATGLTFATTTSTSYGDSTNTFNAVWTATAGSSGSGTVTSVHYGSGGASGIAVFVYRGSDGVGNASSGDTVGTVRSLTRGSANSAVVVVIGDWNAGNDTTVNSSPAGGTQRVATFVSGRATFFLFDWGDQGAAGTTSYGISNFAPTPVMRAAVVEIKGTAAVAAPGRMIRLYGKMRIYGGKLRIFSRP